MLKDYARLQQREVAGETMVVCSRERGSRRGKGANCDTPLMRRGAHPLNRFCLVLFLYFALPSWTIFPHRETARAEVSLGPSKLEAPYLLPLRVQWRRHVHMDAYAQQQYHANTWTHQTCMDPCCHVTKKWNEWRRKQNWHEAHKYLLRPWGVVGCAASPSRATWPHTN